MAKQITYSENARSAILRGVNTLAKVGAGASISGRYWPLITLPTRVQLRPSKRCTWNRLITL